MHACARACACAYFLSRTGVGFLTLGNAICQYEDGVVPPLDASFADSRWVLASHSPLLRRRGGCLGGTGAFQAQGVGIGGPQRKEAFDYEGMLMRGTMCDKRGSGKAEKETSTGDSIGLDGLGTLKCQAVREGKFIFLLPF